jgi:hypothetical protein
MVTGRKRTLCVSNVRVLHTEAYADLRLLRYVRPTDTAVNGHAGANYGRRSDSLGQLDSYPSQTVSCRNCRSTNRKARLSDGRFLVRESRGPGQSWSFENECSKSRRAEGGSIRRPSDKSG